MAGNSPAPSGLLPENGRFFSDTDNGTGKERNMDPEVKSTALKTSKREEEAYLARTLAVVHDNVENYGREVARMQANIDEMLEHYHDNDAEVYTILNLSLIHI